MSSTAHADESPIEPSSAAKEHFSRGATLYEATRYEAALHEFEAAQSIDPRPALIYNIARSLEKLDRRDEALIAYKKYLDEVPEAFNAAAVQERIVALTPALAPRPISIVATIPPRPPKRHWLVPGLVGAGALALAGIGAGLTGSAIADYHNLSAACSPTCPTSSWSMLPAREHAGEALLGIAGAVAVVDVVLIVLESKRRSR